MRLLYVLNVANRVNSFSHTSMLAAKELGIEFHIAGNWGYKSEEERKNDEQKLGIHIHQIDFQRNPLSPANFKAARQLLSVMKKWRFDAMHCNTPVGGLLGRIAAKKMKISQVIYQAHGFHFYKGAPLLNWLIYYPVEKILARHTDALIAINREDFDLAEKKFKLRNGGNMYFVPGVGIDVLQYFVNEINRTEKRTELGLKEDDIALISMGDLIERKNYGVAIRAIAEANNPSLHYFICGNGPEKEKLEDFTRQLGITDQIHFLGFRADVKELLSASDIFLFTTKQEGLPRSMMEAMASGLPCVVSNVRGNVDLVKDMKNAFLCDPENSKKFAEAIKMLAENESLRKESSLECLEQIKKFDIPEIVAITRDIYINEFGIE